MTVPVTVPVTVLDTTRVLVVEDEESYRQALEVGLSREGFTVETAADGPEALRRFADRRPDIVLLDLLLPGMHGTEICRRMHELAPVPIVVVSAVNSELDVVLGLELGAAGYVTKPFRLRELVARMHAILRRVGPPTPLTFGGSTIDAPLAPPGFPGIGLAGPGGRSGSTRGSGPSGPFDLLPGLAGLAGSAGPTGPAAAFGEVTVDILRREVLVGGRPIHLSRREFDLLAVLLNPTRLVRTREELIDLLWPDRSLSDTRTLDTHIHRLRTKLEPDPSDPRYIVTVRGVGFRVDPDGAPMPTPPAATMG